MQDLVNTLFNKAVLSLKRKICLEGFVTSAIVPVPHVPELALDTR